MRVTAIALFLLFPLSLCYLGVDVSTPVSTSAFQCIRNNGFNHFAIVRAYQSLGRPDPNAATTIKNAHAAGFPYVDAYMFPCPKCNISPEKQVADTVENLRRNGARIGMLWLDIEGANYWLGDKNKNREFFIGLIRGVRNTGVKAGVYSSSYQWGQIMGNDFTAGATFPLWYAHYDNKPNFSDFRPFGGWTKPAIKQYYGDAKLCGVGIDKNWY